MDKSTYQTKDNFKSNYDHPFPMLYVADLIIF